MQTFWVFGKSGMTRDWFQQGLGTELCTLVGLISLVHVSSLAIAHLYVWV